MITQGAFALIADARDRLLLLRRPDGRWNLPGGGVMEDERPHDAVVREVWEETRCDTIVVCQIGGPLIFEGESTIDVAVCFHCVVLQQHAPIVLDDEAIDHRFVGINDIYLEDGCLHLKGAEGTIIPTASRGGISRMGRMVFDWFSTRERPFVHLPCAGTLLRGGEIRQVTPSGDGRFLVSASQSCQTYWRRLDPYHSSGYIQ